MNVIKKILNIIFNPLNNLYFKGNEKTVNVFDKHTILIFIVSLLVTGAIFVLCYFVK